MKYVMLKKLDIIAHMYYLRRDKLVRINCSHIATIFHVFCTCDDCIEYFITMHYSCITQQRKKHVFFV